MGCAILRALTIAGLKCVLLERASELLDGASKGNSAILHTGFDAPKGSLELRLIQAGRKAYLDFYASAGLPILKTDATLLAWTPEQVASLPSITAKAHDNGVTSVGPIDMTAFRAQHTHISEAALAGLFVPGEDIIDPWSSPHAYAIQAILNGAVVMRDAQVMAARQNTDGWVLDTPAGAVSAKIVINCAGNFGDHVDALAGRENFKIRPRKGQFVVFDKAARSFTNTIILPVPTARTKGVVVCPTIFGNVLVGPTAEDQDDREDASVVHDTLQGLVNEATRIIPALTDMPVTATYAGLRPASDKSDYIIEADKARHWITVAGIRSTGLTSALGIGDYVAGLVEENFMRMKPIGNPIVPQMPNLAEHLPRDHMMEGRGELVCLCETVTRREIEASLSGPLPAKTLAGIKRRTRALLGRCQGFNCLDAVCKIGTNRLSDVPDMEELPRDS